MPTPTPRSSSDRRAHLRILTILLLTGGGVAVGNAGNAQVLVRVTSFSAATQGPNFVGSFAETNNGVVSTNVGNGGRAVATPSGPGITQGRAETEQPGNQNSNAATTTTANLLNAKHTGAVLAAGTNASSTPGGTSNSRLEDVVTFVNGTGAPVDVSVSWLVDGFVTPPPQPFTTNHDVRAVMRLWGVSASGPAVPRLRGTTGTQNQMAFYYVNGARTYTDDLNGTVFQPGNGAIWTITPIGTGGARMDSVLTLPVGLSALKIMNSFDLDCRGGTTCDYSLTGAQMILGALPPGVAMASASGAFLGAAKPTPTPSGLTVQSIAGNTVTLRWNPPTSEAATGYVLQGGIAPGQTIGSLPTGSTATTFTFGAPTGAFYLRVLAQTANGPSAPSNEVLAYVNVPAPPSAPANLLGVASGGALALSWKNTAGGGTPTGLLLDVSGAVSASLALPVTESFTFPSVPPGSYTFAVRAINGAGPSPASTPVTLTFPGTCPGAPQVPVSLAVTKSGNVLSLAWDPPAAGPAVTGYVLNVSGALSLSLPLTTRSVSGAVPPGAYTFTVTAVSPCGASTPSAPQSITVP